MLGESQVAVVVHAFGGVEDVPALELSSCHGWKVVCLDPASEDVKPAGLRSVIWGPREPYKGAHRALWLPQLLRREGVRTVVLANYPQTLEQAAAFHSMLTPTPLVQLTHGLDDRNRNHPVYDTFRALGEYDLTLVDSSFWRDGILSHEPRGTVRLVGNLELSLWLRRRGVIGGDCGSTVLYAPSWFDPTRPDELGNGWFERAALKVCRSVPSDTFLRVRPHPTSVARSPSEVLSVRNFLAERGNAELVSNRSQSVLDDIAQAAVVITDHSAVAPFALWLDRKVVIYDETPHGAWPTFVQDASTLVRSPSELTDCIAAFATGADDRAAARRCFRRRASLYNPEILDDIGREVTALCAKSGQLPGILEVP